MISSSSANPTRKAIIYTQFMDEETCCLYMESVVKAKRKHM